MTRSTAPGSLTEREHGQVPLRSEAVKKSNLDAARLAAHFAKRWSAEAIERPLWEGGGWSLARRAPSERWRPRRLARLRPRCRMGGLRKCCVSSDMRAFDRLAARRSQASRRGRQRSGRQGRATLKRDCSPALAPERPAVWDVASHGADFASYRVLRRVPRCVTSSNTVCYVESCGAGVASHGV
jgi:hypothetical protein